MKKLYLLRGRNCSVLVALIFSCIQLCAWPTDESTYLASEPLAPMQVDGSTGYYQAGGSDKQFFLLAHWPRKQMGNSYLHPKVDIGLLETSIVTAQGTSPSKSSYDLEKITYLILAMSLSLNVFLFMRDRR